jgi:hypothetical protein
MVLEEKLPGYSLDHDGRMSLWAWFMRRVASSAKRDHQTVQRKKSACHEAVHI